MTTPPSFPADIQDLQRQELHLRDYIRVISKRKTIVLTFLIITFLSVFITTFTTTPLFTASSQVLIERNYGSSAIERGNAYYRWDPDFLTTQFELIRSTNVTHRVVKELKLDTKYKHYFLTEQKKGLFSFISTVKKGSKNFIQRLLSSDTDEVKSTPAASTGLLMTGEEKTDADIIAASIRGNLSIKPVTNTKTVIISYSDKNPAMAKLITNAIIQAYTNEILEIKLASSSYSLQWMTTKADEERKKLEGSELALQQYMRDNNLVTVETYRSRATETD